MDWSLWTQSRWNFTSDSIGIGLRGIHEDLLPQAWDDEVANHAMMSLPSIALMCNIFAQNISETKFFIYVFNSGLHISRYLMTWKERENSQVDFVIYVRWSAPLFLWNRNVRQFSRVAETF